MNTALESLGPIPRTTPKYGAYSILLDIDGFELEVTYDLDGRDLAATREFPAERADVLVVSVAIGDAEVFGVEADVWNDRLSLWESIQEQRE
jgi:hypothetical protein